MSKLAKGGRIDDGASVGISLYRLKCFLQLYDKILEIDGTALFLSCSPQRGLHKEELLDITGKTVET